MLHSQNTTNWFLCVFISPLDHKTKPAADETVIFNLLISTFLFSSTGSRCFSWILSNLILLQGHETNSYTLYESLHHIWCQRLRCCFPVGHDLGFDIVMRRVLTLYLKRLLVSVHKLRRSILSGSAGWKASQVKAHELTGGFLLFVFTEKRLTFSSSLTQRVVIFFFLFILILVFIFICCKRWL